MTNAAAPLHLMEAATAASLTETRTEGPALFNHLNKLELHFVYEGVQSRPFSLNYVVKNEILNKISLLFKNKVLHLQLID